MTRPVIAHIAEEAHMLSFQEKTGRDMFFDLQPSQCYVWRTLYKKSFLKEMNLSFIPGIRHQDIPFTTECYIKACKCIKAYQLLYVYRKRYVYPTFAANKKMYYEIATAISKTWELLSRNQLSGKMRAKLEDNVYTNLINFSRRVSHLSNDFKVREGVYDHLRKSINDLHFKNKISHRLFSYLFCHYPFLFNFSRYLYVKIVEDKLIRCF